MPNPILAVTEGDPAEIGLEIALKALADKQVLAACRPLLVGDAEVLTYFGDLLKISLALKPIAAVAEARKEGIQAAGPFGADTLLLRKDFDGYLMMLHDQGHIPAKLLGFDRTSALTIGAPVRFATVAHGSGLDIAGKGLADPSCLIRTIERMAAGTVESAKTSPPVRRQAKNN